MSEPIDNKESFDFDRFIDLYNKYKASNYDEIQLFITEFEKLQNDLSDLKIFKQIEAQKKNIKKWNAKNMDKVREIKRKSAAKMREKKKLEKAQKENSNEEN